MGNITVGVTGWGDHDELYEGGVKPSDKLSVYASHFPIVEVDSSFYAIQSVRNYEKWAAVTPERFGFIVKAYQAMTGHDRKGTHAPELSLEQIFERFMESVQPLKTAGKLKMLLFQFPPWFDCTKENVAYLRWCREMYPKEPIAVEFRNRTWFTEEMAPHTLDFLKRQGFINVICDEPQVGKGSIPIVPEVTHPDYSLVRLHGRNRAGWVYSGEGDWRAVRYNYNYNKTELGEWADRIQHVAHKTGEVCVLFNNNSAGDAVPNAKTFIHMLGLDFDGLAPRQMELF